MALFFVFSFKIYCTTNSSFTSTSVTGHGCRRRWRLRQPGGGLWRRQLGGVDLSSRQLVPADRRQTALPRLHAERSGGVVQRAEAAAAVARQVGVHSYCYYQWIRGTSDQRSYCAGLLVKPPKTKQWGLCMKGERHLSGLSVMAIRGLTRSWPPVWGRRRPGGIHTANCCNVWCVQRTVWTLFILLSHYPLFKPRPQLKADGYIEGFTTDHYIKIFTERWTQKCSCTLV